MRIETKEYLHTHILEDVACKGKMLCYPCGESPEATYYPDSLDGCPVCEKKESYDWWS